VPAIHNFSWPLVVLVVSRMQNANDALESLMVGASTIQIGTINFTNPRAGVEIVEGIEVFLHKGGIDNIVEVIGAAL
jgi:dihydroorotate dehydrogenase (NAD+) catalytic subunit